MPTWNRVVVEDNSGNASITGNTLTFANAESINNTTNGTIEIDADIAKVKDIYITDGEILVPVSGTPTSIMSRGALTGTVAGDTLVLFDEIRGFGTDQAKLSHFNKDFAISYDRQICLVDGQYVISYSTQGATSIDRISILVNGDLVWNGYTNDTAKWQQMAGSTSVHLKRGD